MKNKRKHYDSPRSTDFRKDGVWAANLGFYLLWMEYLAISPSYELARRFRANDLSEQELHTLPADFEDVLAVYDDLGDVQRVRFLDWWSERALSVFGYKGSKPRVRKVDTLRSDRHRKAASRLQEFIEDDWTEQGQPNAMVVSIPLGLSKAQVTRQLSKIVDKSQQERRILPEPVAKYPLLGTRQRKDTLFRYLYVVWVRSAMPRQALWRVGARAKVSDTYSRELDPKVRIPRGELTYDRSVLSALTSRAWSRGVALAENASRGRFPSYDKVEHGLEPNLNDSWGLISSRRRWKKKLRRSKH